MKETQNSNIYSVSTIFNSNVISRPQINIPISETDLENYAAESAWKTFDKFRADVSERLNINEIDLTIRDVRIVGVKVDGHRVINPVGFMGKKVELTLLVTIGGKNSSALIEAESLTTYVMSEDMNAEGALYAKIGWERTEICGRNGDKTLCVGSVGWGKLHILKALGEFFLAEETVSDMILQRFLSADVSDELMVRIDKIFYSEFKSFLKQLSHLISITPELKRAPISSIFIDGIAMPKNFSGKRFLFNNKKVKIVEVGQDRKAEAFLDAKMRAYGHVNELVGKRMKWVAN